MCLAAMSTIFFSGQGTRAFCTASLAFCGMDHYGFSNFLWLCWRTLEASFAIGIGPFSLL